MRCGCAAVQDANSVRDVERGLARLKREEKQDVCACLLPTTFFKYDKFRCSTRRDPCSTVQGLLLSHQKPVRNGNIFLRLFAEGVLFFLGVLKYGFAQFFRIDTEKILVDDGPTGHDGPGFAGAPSLAATQRGSQFEVGSNVAV
jgi:hypothetical protein